MKKTSVRARRPGRLERRLCCQCHKRPKASNRSYCKACWAERARIKRLAAKPIVAPPW